MIHPCNRSHPLPIALILLLALPGTAVASGEHDGGHNGDQAEHGGDGHHGDDEAHGHGGDGHSAGFGRPAKADQADRTVRITALDTMRFKPQSIQVEAGETVRFVVENPGQLQHSFTLGTPAGQRAHEKEMQGMPIERMAGHMDNDPTGMVIQPGGTESLTWRFKRGGAVQFACHIPGHYDAGMKGRIRVE